MVTPSSCVSKTKPGCQDLNEVWDWGWDASRFLRSRPGQSIVQVVWSVPNEFNKITEDIVGNTFTARIQNNTGVVDGVYPLIATATLSGGEIMLLRIDITLTDIAA